MSFRLQPATQLCRTSETKQRDKNWLTLQREALKFTAVKLASCSILSCLDFSFHSFYLSRAAFSTQGEKNEPLLGSPSPPAPPQPLFWILLAKKRKSVTKTLSFPLSLSQMTEFKWTGGCDGECVEFKEPRGRVREINMRRTLRLLLFRSSFAEKNGACLEEFCIAATFSFCFVFNAEFYRLAFKCNGFRCFILKIVFMTLVA